MHRFVVVAFLLAAALAVPAVLRSTGLGLTSPQAAFELAPATTDEPPPWRLERVGGGHMALSDLKGSVTILYFWASW